MPDTNASILYWNMHKNAACLPVLQALIIEREPKVVMLAESPPDEQVVLAALGPNYRAHSSSHDYVRFYASTPDFTIENDSFKRLVMARLGSNENSLLLVGMHLPSKLYGQSANKQARKAENYRLLIEEQEQALGIYKTILFGDFNMNPYEWGMLDRSRGFRTVSTRRLALQSIKPSIPKAEDEDDPALPRRCFYNPMWAWLGDYFPHTSTLKPSGTHFWSPSNPEDTHWNSLDSILVSPEAISQFPIESVEVITRTVAGHLLFTVNGTLAKSSYSDHLPLYFKLLLP
jgi:endonuclease/exonuclease/phosphatase family metal-dependent hydrolase